MQVFDSALGQYDSQVGYSPLLCVDFNPMNLPQEEIVRSQDLSPDQRCRNYHEHVLAVKSTFSV
jgi:hypothetical protein